LVKPGNAGEPDRPRTSQAPRISNTNKETEAMTERVRGTVKWFNSAKGYGFIEREDGPDVFVHFTSLQAEGYRTLNEGQEVEFSIEDSPKGLQAVDVTII
jgi:CspA family cold shock protein